MPLKRHVYDVYLHPVDPDGLVLEAAEPTVHRVEVKHGDMLRGELEAGKQGLPNVGDAPLNATTVYVWCAMTRLGLVQVDYQTFKHQHLAGFDAVKDEPVPDVDPTQAAPSASPSPSPATSVAAPPSGSTPTPPSTATNA